MTKRICSLLLTLCLIFSLSTFAFATNGAHKTVDYIAQDWIDTQFSGDAEMLRYQIPSSYVRIILAKLLAT